MEESQVLEVVRRTSSSQAVCLGRAHPYGPTHCLLKRQVLDTYFHSTKHSKALPPQLRDTKPINPQSPLRSL